MINTKTSNPTLCVGSTHDDLGKLVHSALGGEKTGGSLGSCGYGSPAFYECASAGVLAGDVPVYTAIGEVSKLQATIALPGGVTCELNTDNVFA
tara:strand:- start:847 stop:1128 length:282 start_codon:yes stop_codon:yes gene_type:complete